PGRYVLLQHHRHFGVDSGSIQHVGVCATRTWRRWPRRWTRLRSRRRRRGSWWWSRLRPWLRPRLWPRLWLWRRVLRACLLWGWRHTTLREMRLTHERGSGLRRPAFLGRRSVAAYLGSDVVPIRY